MSFSFLFVSGVRKCVCVYKNFLILRSPLRYAKEVLGEKFGCILYVCVNDEFASADARQDAIRIIFKFAGWIDKNEYND